MADYSATAAAGSTAARSAGARSGARPAGARPAGARSAARDRARSSPYRSPSIDALAAAAAASAEATRAVKARIAAAAPSAAARSAAARSAATRIAARSAAARSPAARLAARSAALLAARSAATEDGPGSPIFQIDDYFWDEIDYVALDVNLDGVSNIQTSHIATRLSEISLEDQRNQDSGRQPTGCSMESTYDFKWELYPPTGSCCGEVAKCAWTAGSTAPAIAASDEELKSDFSHAAINKMPN